MDVVSIELDNAHHNAIAPCLSAMLQLDIDLAATHDVETAAVVARDLRMRGPLVSVDEEEPLRLSPVPGPAFRQIHRISRRKLLEFFL